MAIRISEDEYQSLLCRQGKNPAQRAHGKGKRPPKHRNIKQYLYEDGTVLASKYEAGHGRIVQVYDSTKEYLRHRELKLLERVGQISQLECQKVLPIAPGFTNKLGNSHRPVNYKADFFYMRNGLQVVEDVKAFDIVRQRFLTTEAFNIKWKLLQAKYPDYIFELY